MSVPRISFWLFILAVCGFDSLKDLKFIGSIDPEMATSLAPWPLDDEVPLALTSCASGISPLGQLLANYLNIMPSELMGCTIEERKAYTNEIYSRALFQTSYEAIIGHPEILALLDGFNVPINSETSLCDTFGSSPKTPSLQNAGKKPSVGG